ncbi:MAG: transposase [bacterium]|nr:transposase [bacterium]
MARLARVVAPGLPYHVTHRGNRCQDVFFDPQDRQIYKDWLALYSRRYGLEIWAYCLMTNHIHLIVVNRKNDSLARTVGCTHGRFAQRQNRLNGWSGHLWANRFFSTPLDEAHLWAAARYVEMNPVRAGISAEPAAYKWSSARAHISGRHDALLSPARPFPGEVPDWSQWLTGNLDVERVETIRKNTATGRPSGSASFTSELERRLDRRLRPRRRGRKPKKKVGDLR